MLTKYCRVIFALSWLLLGSFSRASQIVEYILYGDIPYSKTITRPGNSFICFALDGVDVTTPTWLECSARITSPGGPGGYAVFISDGLNVHDVSGGADPGEKVSAFIRLAPGDLILVTIVGDSNASAAPVSFDFEIKQPTFTASPTPQLLTGSAPKTFTGIFPGNRDTEFRYTASATGRHTFTLNAATTSSWWIWDMWAQGSSFPRSADITKNLSPKTLTMDLVAGQEYRFWSGQREGQTFTSGGVPMPYTLEVALQTTDPFLAWSQSKFTAAELANTAISGPEADPDRDGMKNLMEYALGGLPKTADRSKLPEAYKQGQQFRLRYSRPSGLLGVNYRVVFAETPAGPWSPTAVVAASATVASGEETLTYRVLEPVPPTGFMRLEVTRP